MDCDNSGCLIGVTSCVCCFAISLTAILVLVAYSAVGPLEVGVKVNSFSHYAYLEDGPYPPGLYYTGITGGFVKYPTNIQVIEFSNEGGTVDGSSLSTWSKDGQLLSVEISFFFKLNVSAVTDIYKKYESEWRLPLVRRTWGAIKAETCLHLTTEFFSDRPAIKQGITTRLQAVLQSQGFILMDVQLRLVDIPDGFDDSIQAKQVAQQNIVTQVTNRTYTLVTANTSVIIAAAQKSVDIIQAQSTNLASLTVGNATAQGFEIVQKQLAHSYGSIANTFGFFNKQLLQYAYLSNIKDRKTNIKMFVGFSPSVVETQPGKITPAVQELKVANAISGTFTLSFGGYTTGPLQYNVDGAALTSTLQALDSIGTVKVTATMGTTNIYRITFLTNHGDLPDLTPTTSLNPGSTIDVATVVKGVGEPNYVYQWK